MVWQKCRLPFTATRCIKTHFKTRTSLNKAIRPPQSSLPTWPVTSWRINTSDNPGSNTGHECVLDPWLWAKRHAPTYTHSPIFFTPMFNQLVSFKGHYWHDKTFLAHNACQFYLSFIFDPFLFELSCCWTIMGLCNQIVWKFKHKICFYSTAWYVILTLVVKIRGTHKSLSINRKNLSLASNK